MAYGFEHLDAIAGLPVTRSPMIPDGQYFLFTEMAGLPTRVYVATHDRFGYPLRIPGEKWPFYTRYCLGGREAARDRRKRRRR